MWLSWLNTIQYTEGSPIWFPVRAHTQAEEKEQTQRTRASRLQDLVVKLQESRQRATGDRIFSNSHSERRAITAPVALICVFLMLRDVENFSFTCSSFAYLLWENVYLVPLPVLKLACLLFYYWVIEFLMYFRYLSLSNIWFTNILSRCVQVVFLFC